MVHREKDMREQHWEGASARRYARTMGRHRALLYGRFADMIIERVGDGTGKAILELSCGPGFLALEVCKRLPGCRYTATDPSKTMLELTKENATNEGTPNIETLLGTAESIPMRGSSVNVVLNQRSFHDWHDQAKGVSETFRVLRKQGLFIIQDNNRDASMLDLLGVALRGLVRGGPSAASAFVHSVKKGLPIGRMTHLLTDAGFEVTEARKRGVFVEIVARKP